MEPENIGIGYIIQQVHANPEKYAETIARRVARLIIKKLVIAEQEGQTLNDDQLLAVADRIPSQKQIEKMSPIVVQLIQEHARGSTSLTETETETPKKRIHDSMRNLVSRACMELLANQLHKHVELAEYIHSHPDLSIRILNQPERRSIFEHGVIPGNRTLLDIGDANTQFWTGHDTQKRHISSDGVKKDNILMLLERNTESDNFRISSILHGENIKIFENQIIVFRDSVVSIYKKPDNNNPRNLTLLGEFPCDFNIKNISYFQAKNGWCMYRVKPEDGSSDEDSEEVGATICTHAENPQLSFMARSRRYMINGNPFVVDIFTKQITVLTRTGLIEIPFDGTGNKAKEGNGEEYLVFNQDGIQKKLTFSSGNPEVSDIAE